jgi:ATP-binding cassette subfamily B protein
MKPFRLIFQYSKQYTVQLIFTVISMLLLVGTQLLLPWIIKTLIANVTATETASRSIDLITTLALVVLGIYIMRGFLQFIRSYIAHIAGWGVVADLRRHLYNHLQRLSLRFYEDKQTGQLMSQVVNDSDLFETLIAHAVPDVLVNVLTLIGVIAVLVMLNWQLLLLSLLPVPLIIGSLRIYAKYVRPAFRFRQKELGE